MNNTITRQEIEKADKLANQFVSELKPFVHQHFIQLADVFEKIIDTYYVIVHSGDYDDFDEEATNRSAIAYDYFKKYISGPYDIFILAAHLAGHVYCFELWKKSRVPRTLLPERLHDLAEDMFTQRLFQFIAPSLVEPVTKSLALFDAYKPYKNRDLRLVINSVLSEEVHDDVPIELKAIRHYLYTHNPFEQETFDCFVRGWIGMLKKPELMELFVNYDA